MKLRITMAQLDLAWEDKPANYARAEKAIAEVAGQTDLVVLPEMFSTGFSMRSEDLAEPITGPTVSRVKEWAARYDLAICGSFIASDRGGYYNRGFFIAPDIENYYDKRHLFRMGDEINHYSACDQRLIVPYKDFKICLMICYDLRFPVWARNVDNAYDLLIYVASWPESRIDAWNALLRARAIENLAYVCGVNRSGLGANGLSYNGNSLFADFKGRILAHLTSGEEELSTISIDRDELLAFREAFPAWMDADRFEIIL